MQAFKYENYSERKLFNALDATRATLKKLQSEQARLTKKINDALQKQNEIKSVLALKLNEPNEATINAIKSCEAGGSGEVVESLSGFHQRMLSEVANEN